jgi:Integrase core domain
MIPLHERHLRRVLAEWMPHYNGERPHSALGPGLPDKPTGWATLTGHSLSPLVETPRYDEAGTVNVHLVWAAGNSKEWGATEITCPSPSLLLCHRRLSPLAGAEHLVPDRSPASARLRAAGRTGRPFASANPSLYSAVSRSQSGQKGGLMSSDTRGRIAALRFDPKQLSRHRIVDA